MAYLINEAKRMQELAGILNENPQDDAFLNTVYKQFIDDQEAGHTTEKQVTKAAEYIFRNMLRVLSFKEKGLDFAVEHVYRAINGALGF